MWNVTRSYTSAAILVILATIQSHANQWNPPASGYVIRLTTPTGIPQKSGQSVRIEGSVVPYGTTGSYTKQDLLHDLEAHSAQLRAYFPDRNHEVTSAISLTNDLRFTFSSPPLDPTAPNTFIVVIEHMPPELEALAKVGEKLTKRAQKLNGIITKSVERADRAEDIKALLAVKERFAQLHSKVEKHLERKRETLAEATLPLQVDNVVAAASLYSTLSAGIRVETRADVGSAIQGEKVVFSSKVKNTALAENSEVPQYEIKLLWKGTEIANTGAIPLPGGAEKTFQFKSERLSPNDQNRLSTVLYKIEKNAGLSRKEWARLDFDLPVAIDTTNPIWDQNRSPNPDHAFVQNMEPVYFRVADAFGLLDLEAFRMILDGRIDPNLPPGFPIFPPDRDGIQATLEGILTSGQNYSQVVTDKLTIMSPNQGQDFIVSGDLNPLPEGVFTLKLQGKDLAGNNALPDPITSTFVIDRTSPVISAIFPPSEAALSVAEFAVSATSNEPLMYAEINHEPLFISHDRRSVSGVINASVAGTLHLHWKFVDLAGNTTSKDTVAILPDSAISDTNATIAADKSLLRVKVGATNNESTSYQGVILDFHSVDLIRSDNSVLEADHAAVEVDVLNFETHVRTLIARSLVPAAAYKGIRVKFGPFNRVVIAGVEYPLTLKSSLGGSVQAYATIGLVGAHIGQVQLALDVANSISFSPGKGYVLDPLLSFKSLETPTVDQENRLRSIAGSELDHMYQSADLVIQGEAGSSVASEGFHGNRRMFFTKQKITVVDKLKGSAPTEIELELLGGTIGDRSIHVSHVTYYDTGESFLLFLKQWPTGLGTISEKGGKVDLE